MHDSHLFPLVSDRNNFIVELGWDVSDSPLILPFPDPDTLSVISHSLLFGQLGRLYRFWNMFLVISQSASGKGQAQIKTILKVVHE